MACKYNAVEKRGELVLNDVLEGNLFNKTIAHSLAFLLNNKPHVSWGRN